jgi:hypothetical protein
MILNPADEINKKWTCDTTPWAQKLTPHLGVANTFNIGNPTI